jgi:tRNA G18 (ribose-2'-O)-methylase SpoU
MKKINPLSSVELFRSLETNQFYNLNQRPIIIADNLRTPENMGAVLRLAGNVGARLTIFIADEPLNFKTYKIKRTASGAFEKCDWKIITLQELPQYIPSDYIIVALETSSNATNIYTTPLPRKMAMIVGNELFGIGSELMQMAQLKVYIPLPGKIYSLNVTHALSVGLFEWYRQQSI